MALRLKGPFSNLLCRFDTLSTKSLAGLSSYSCYRLISSRAKQHSSSNVSVYQCRFTSNYNAMAVHTSLRACSSSSSSLVCQNLKHRAIVKIVGSDTSALLQGIITNDITSLLKSAQTEAQYTFMLNLQVSKW